MQLAECEASGGTCFYDAMVQCLELLDHPGLSAPEVACHMGHVAVRFSRTLGPFPVWQCILFARGEALLLTFGDFDAYS